MLFQDPLFKEIKMEPVQENPKFIMCVATYKDPRNRHSEKVVRVTGVLTDFETDQIVEEKEYWVRNFTDKQLDDCFEEIFKLAKEKKAHISVIKNPVNLERIDDKTCVSVMLSKDDYIRNKKRVV